MSKNINKLIAIVFIVIVGFLLCIQANAQSVIYVTENGDGDFSGTSWNNALPGGQLATKLAGVASNSIFYVAKGIYYPSANPTAETDKSLTFALIQGVKLYGGFSGTEPVINASVLEARNFVVNETILSGNIGLPSVSTDNCNHVVTISGANTLLDGATVSDGYSTSQGGGGIYGSAAVTLSNVVVKNNTSIVSGGGIHAASTLSLSNATVNDNKAIGNGGGISAAAKTILNNVTASYNKTSGSGGGICFSPGDSLILIGKIEFVKDTAGIAPGASNLGGAGISMTGVNGKLVATYEKGLASMLIDSCYATLGDGGAIGVNINQATSNNASIYIKGNLNCPITISNNYAGRNGGAISGRSNYVQLQNIYFYKNQGNGGSGGGALFLSNTLTSGSAAYNREVVQCTFRENIISASSAGGAIFVGTGNSDTTVVTNCTFYGNKDLGTSAGAAIQAGSPAKVTFCTFYGNIPARSINSSVSSAFNGNIVSDNIGTSTIAGFSGSYNIVGIKADSSSLGGATNKVITDLSKIFTQTVPTNNNGGPTPTLMIKYGGPAHNFVPLSTNGWGIDNDQCNAFRPIGCGYDAGSVEIQEEDDETAYSIRPYNAVCYNSMLDADSLITSTVNIKDTIYYSKRSYAAADIITMPVRITNQNYIYVKFITTSNCEMRDSIPLTIAYCMQFKTVADEYIACPNASVILAMQPVNGISFYWYASQTAVNPLRSASDTCTVVKDNSSLQTFWVEPHAGSVVLGRIPVDVLLSENCGGTVPVGCALTGTLLFREDYGTGTAQYRTTGLPAGTTDYTYRGSTTGAYNGGYWLMLYNSATLPAVWQRNFYDHTSQTTGVRGYMFIADAANAPGMFYKKTLDNLCSGTKLYFSAWLINMVRAGAAQTDDPSLRFDLEDSNGNVLTTYYSGIIPRDANNNATWKQYGTEFTVPAGQASVVLKIYNSTLGSSGNDLAMDDIEVRLCMPHVSIGQPDNSDTTVCVGTRFDFSGSYTDDGTFGTPLTYRWEYSATGDVTNPADWTPVFGGNETETSGSISSHPSIANVTMSDEGYYRMIVGNASTINANDCRAMSRIVHLMVTDAGVYPDAASITTSVSGNSVTVNVPVVNEGSVTFGSPVYVTLYKNSISSVNKIVSGSANIQILTSDTGVVSVTIPDITIPNPVNIVIRVNDDGATFPYQPECNVTNNEATIINPTIRLMMKKNATLDGSPHNGTYDNPVSTLFSEIIEYTITAVNANLSTGKVIIRDTLPPYLNFDSSNPPIVPTVAGSAPQRDALEWTIAGVASMATMTVTVKATPQAGSVSSQPMFINRAWVTVSDTITVPTNSTYHQGASVGVATFSAGFGGTIYNAVEQALDYRTTPRTGIVIVPDEGYRFAGWSHEDYVSLKGHTIQAEEGIMHYDTLTVYGDIKLNANFELEHYPIAYYLNSSVNADENPEIYTIQSGDITLSAPEKLSDIFTGWTGSNGDEPQKTVTIPAGSTGELVYYANFLHSGREAEEVISVDKDKVWAFKNELYVRTLGAGSIVRIYSTEGVLQKQQTLLQPGESKIKLQRGVYIVTLNNGMGRLVRID